MPFVSFASHRWGRAVADQAALFIVRTVTSSPTEEQRHRSHSHATSSAASASQRAASAVGPLVREPPPSVATAFSSELLCRH
ncbi:hypothetical protein Syun_019071 [Stephania yunnanensis]|uniref:Uncharacterized protein n=1 Tax=Stephania yunnanensis TaxID=152371 RepID=A0AAP0ITF6_9MAGN